MVTFNDNIVKDNLILVLVHDLIPVHDDIVDDTNVQDDVFDVIKYGKIVKSSLILVLWETEHLRANILTKLLLVRIYL